MQPKYRFPLAVLISLSFILGVGTHQNVLATDFKNMPFTPNTIADIAEKASPAVVHLEMQRKLKQASFGGIPITEFYFNGQRVAPEDDSKPKNDAGADDKNKGAAPNSAPKTGTGSKPKGLNTPMRPGDIATGFIIRQDGYIVTNFHAVDGQDRIKVTLWDKRVFEGSIVGIDPFSDLAVVKIEAKDLPTLNFGSSAALRPGEFSVAIGSPLNEDHSVTLGIISAVGRTERDVNGNINFIQTDTAINPGNSGGPLLNLNGEVVGVNTAIRPLAQNIAYSIPADIAKNVAEELIAKGKIDRPWLGVVMSELEEGYLKGVELPDTTKGVLIRDFVQGSPGQASGLVRGDIIQKIDNKPMNLPKDVKDYVQSRKSGDVLQFTILRNKANQNFSVSVGTYPKEAGPSRRPR